jgi:hypothetical protein
MINTLAPQVPALPHTIDITVRRRGNDWIEYDQKMTMHSYDPNIPAHVETWRRVTGPGQIGGIWLPPAGLAPLRQGQSIDNDPVTGVQTIVSYVGRDNQGRSVVTITETGAAHSVAYTYDASTGLMVHLRHSLAMPATNSELITEVSLVSQR